MRAARDERRRNAGRSRVLVLGDRTEVALAACRALGRAGYVVGVTGWRRFDEAGVSRHVSRYHRIPRHDVDGGAWARALRRLVRSNAYDVVVASSDAGVAALLELDLPVPTCPQISPTNLALIDKARLADLCAEAGVRYPRTEQPRTVEEDTAAARRVRGPAIVKAARPAVVTDAGVSALPGARLVTDEAEALGALSEIRERGFDPIVQEHLRGAKLQAMIIRRSSETVFRFAFDVLREFPPARGAEAMLEDLATDTGAGSEMVEALEKLADAAGYEGFLGAEFLRDDSTRGLFVVDVNPRLGGALPFAELLGQRLTERTVRDAMGLPPMPMQSHRAGRRYHHLAREIRGLRTQRPTSRRYLATVGLRELWDLPSITDPLPTLLRLRRLMGSAMRGRHHGR